MSQYPIDDKCRTGIEDMTQLLGKRIRAPLETLGLLSEFDADLRSVRQPLDRFWKEHQGKLSNLRCMSAAHRDLNGLSLLESVGSIDILEIMNLGFEVGEILNEIGNVVQSIVEECSTVPPPELKASA